MKAFKVDLTKDYAVQGGELECILMECPFETYAGVTDWKRPAVIVVPGGAYQMVSIHEGPPVAAAFLSKGFQTFVLNYLTAPDGVSYPEELLELASAVDYVRKHAEEFNVNPDEIFVVGFSAGGHLTGNLAVSHQDVSKMAGVELDCKPTAVGLSYPVIREAGHIESLNNLLQGYTDEAKAELLKTLNLNDAVSEQTPPAFIWATAPDDVVPGDNAIQYALALARKNIPYELHIYPQGPHGLSVGDREVNQRADYLTKVSQWVDNCASFFRLFAKEEF